jgi:adenine-specific DNA-methyltransferase
MSNPDAIAESDVEASAHEKASIDSSARQSRDDRQRQYAQFFTPAVIANLMASFFAVRREEVRLLDAGAGMGALTQATVSRYCSAADRPTSINVTLFEVDDALIPELRASMLLCEQQCLAAHIAFAFKIQNEDFVLSASRELELFGRRIGSFNAAIVNPPYQKIRSDSAARAALSSTGIETSNLYTAFLALILRLLEPGGELVAITPRSFCNGPYFRPFRTDLLESAAVKRLHVFESRKAAFIADGVLQENVILYAVKNAEQQSSVIVSSSDGSPGGAVTERDVAFNDVVNESDSEKFIHLPVNDALANAQRVLRQLTSSLPDLGITVSTGRVVDFRAREFLKNEPGQGTAPLIYPAHLDGMSIRWPLIGGRKANAIAVTPDTQGLLVQSGVYVLTKRFTAKEERKRVVASVFDPEMIPDPLIAFENHLNYFHQNGGGLPRELARGLAVFLNSSFVDLYLRRFSGHTQVNATDLRNLPYPDRDILNRLGGHAHQVGGDQRLIDDAVERELAALVTDQLAAIEFRDSVATEQLQKA